MTHATLSYSVPAIFNGNPRLLAREPSPPAAPRAPTLCDQESFFSSLPRHVIRGINQPPAWWLDERAKLVAKTALAT
jgi:hypothetical protein